MAAVLKSKGCYFVRYGKGDHEIWHSPITDRNFSVDKSCMSRFTANAIIKQAGIDHKF
ncbi:type II toxin-antitoxin system HicA family toxin [Neorhizobium sp. CSC1952]|nr:type II toxin-antitoxin system HicA family toxin [Rhizobium sp. CSC1952]WJR69520.1 type II toxin-antitoxin system HicA family toxin [Rhizobium sp. CSC1952]